MQSSPLMVPKLPSLSNPSSVVLCILSAHVAVTPSKPVIAADCNPLW